MIVHIAVVEGVVYWSRVEYLYRDRESSDIEGPEIDGHVTHGAILFHKS